MKPIHRNIAVGTFFCLIFPHCWLALSLDRITSRQQQDDEEVVRVNSDVVVLNVTVTDASGKFVSGLTKKDFRIFEDSAEQRISSFGAEETPFAAAILLDFSGSMEQRVTLA